MCCPAGSHGGRHNQRGPPITTSVPTAGAKEGPNPETPRMESANFCADHAAKFDIAAAGLGGHRAKHRIQRRGRPPHDPSLRPLGRRRGSWGGRPRLKEGHAEKIDCDSAEARFCFFQIVQGVAEPPPRAGPTRQNTPVCLYFSCLEFSENAS